MKELIIEKTAKTPYINFNSKTGILRIEGRSIPENPEEFYSELMNWVDGYFKQPLNETKVNIQLEYINSGSSKFILELFQKLQDYNNKGKKCSIDWYYEEGDEDMRDVGEELAEMVDFEFKYIMMKE